MSEQSPVVALPAYALRPSTVTPPGVESTRGGCVDCGPGSSSPTAAVAEVSNPVPVWGGFAYGVGRLNARFPSLGAEREYAQLVGGDPDAIVRTADLKETLSKEENRYLARQLCWTFSGPGGEAFVVVPRDGDDLSELLDALSADESTVHVVVGSPTSATPAVAACVSSGLPAVLPDQLLVFTREEFLSALPEPDADNPLNSALP